MGVLPFTSHLRMALLRYRDVIWLIWECVGNLLKFGCNPAVGYLDGYVNLPQNLIVRYTPLYVASQKVWKFISL